MQIGSHEPCDTPNLTVNTIWVGSVLRMPLAFAAFLRHLGAPVQRQLRRQGLPAFSEDPDLFVPLRKAWAFFDSTAQSEDPMLGWHVGRFVGDDNLNQNLLRKLENAPTLYQALKRLIRMISAEASHLQLGILERERDILFYTQYSTLKDMPGYSSSQAYQLEVYLDLIRHFVSRDWVPEEVGIECPVVPRVVEEHFRGCRVLTGQRVGYIAVPRTILHMATRGSGRETRADGPLALTQDFDYVDTLKALLNSYLADGYPPARTAARLMDTSVRTLARRLAEQGLSYRGVVDDVRFSAACGLLQKTEAPIGEVARSVGFDDPAHFTRLFRRVGGLTPKQFRKLQSG